MQNLRIIVDKCEKMRYFIIKVLEKSEFSLFLTGVVFMYVSPKIYKIFSSVTFIFCLFSFICSIGMVLNINDTIEQILNVFPIFDAIDIAGIKFVVTSILVITSLISLVSAFFEFSAMYTFGNVIEYKNSHLEESMKRRFFALPSKTYRVYGIVLFCVSCIFSLALDISMLKLCSELNSLWGLAVVCIVFSILFNIWIYLWGVVRYKAVSEIMRDAYGEKLHGFSTLSLVQLRLCCPIISVFSVFVIALNIFAMFICFRPLSVIMGITGAWWMIFVWFILIYVQVLACQIYNCYADDIAIMVEHS